MGIDLGGFLAISILLIVAPGPDMVLVARNTLRGGRRSGSRPASASRSACSCGRLRRPSVWRRCCAPPSLHSSGSRSPEPAISSISAHGRCGTRFTAPSGPVTPAAARVERCAKGSSATSATRRSQCSSRVPATVRPRHPSVVRGAPGPRPSLRRTGACLAHGVQRPRRAGRRRSATLGDPSRARRAHRRRAHRSRCTAGARAPLICRRHRGCAVGRPRRNAPAVTAANARIRTAPNAPAGIDSSSTTVPAAIGKAFVNNVASPATVSALPAW